MSNCRRAPPWQGQWPAIGVVAAGGAIGAVARYGAALLWPTGNGTFPWTTLTVNAVGCALMGVLMVVITEIRPAHRLVRPFLGTGILGGFTTFSTFGLDTFLLARNQATGYAFANVVGQVAQLVPEARGHGQGQYIQQNTKSKAATATQSYLQLL